MKSYPLKLVGERRFATMDFTAQLANIIAQIGTNVTLTGCTVSIAVYADGVDNNPSNVLDGVTTFSGSVAGQWIKAGIAGVSYILTWSATFSDGSTPIRQRLLPVVAQF